MLHLLAPEKEREKRRAMTGSGQQRSLDPKSTQSNWPRWPGSAQSLSTRRGPRPSSTADPCRSCWWQHWRWRYWAEAHLIVSRGYLQIQAARSRIATGNNVDLMWLNHIFNQHRLGVEKQRTSRDLISGGSKMTKMFSRRWPKCSQGNLKHQIGADALIETVWVTRHWWRSSGAGAKVLMNICSKNFRLCCHEAELMALMLALKVTTSGLICADNIPSKKLKASCHCPPFAWAELIAMPVKAQVLVLPGQPWIPSRKLPVNVASLQFLV